MTAFGPSSVHDEMGGLGDAAELKSSAKATFGSFLAGRPSHRCIKCPILSYQWFVPKDGGGVPNAKVKSPIVTSIKVSIDWLPRMPACGSRRNLLRVFDIYRLPGTQNLANVFESVWKG